MILKKANVGFAELVYSLFKLQSSQVHLFLLRGVKPVKIGLTVTNLSHYYIMCASSVAF